MKKVLSYFIVILIAMATFYLSYGYRDTKSTKTFYKVYLNKEVLGVIRSKDLLEQYINNENEDIKEKYKVDKVYVPNNLIIKQISSFNQDVMEVEDMYKKIKDKAEFTIEGYQVTIKTDDEPKYIYVINEEVLKSAILNLIKTYVGSERYATYIEDRQDEIVDVGSILENVYVKDNMTIKKIHIPINETIYSNESDLSNYLLYGENKESKSYVVKVGDTISSLSAANEISTEEFLISNPKFTDVNNLLHVGEKVTIAAPVPQLEVVTEEYEVVDKSSAFLTEERYDSTMYVGTTKVIQEGQNGILRVSQKVQSVNGNITYIEPISRQEIKAPITKIILKGSQQKPSVGDLDNWAWPTGPGYTITGGFGWRINPIFNSRENHPGIDVAGLGYGAPIYAANNGVVITRVYRYDYGNYIVINHNNGYYTLYGHMSRFAPNIRQGDIVMRGQLIGYMGSTGWSTGPHLHYEVWKKCQYCRVSPFSLYE